MFFFQMVPFVKWKGEQDTQKKIYKKRAWYFIYKKSFNSIKRQTILKNGQNILTELQESRHTFDQ